MGPNVVEEPYHLVLTDFNCGGVVKEVGDRPAYDGHPMHKYNENNEPILTSENEKQYGSGENVNAQYIPGESFVIRKKSDIETVFFLFFASEVFFFGACEGIVSV